ncbi:hypothetical protein [Nitrosomonas sp.]|uniref:hypothetical protein n=1 Tax=Nitrosomonas sp. TaxID=42353 RepID=UPI00272EF8DF|nr:hypothetical protein [Nitrosomonas sp.]MDP1787570.1 hypothetical protein [Nitrosomonas sp.]
MSMIRHQTISMQGNVALSRVFTQPFNKKLAIIIRKEYRLTIHPTLDDMLRIPWQINSSSARHESRNFRRLVTLRILYYFNFFQFLSGQGKNLMTATIKLPTVNVVANDQIEKK